MESGKQTGFTLFPTPPTPPAKRSRARTKSSSGSSRSSKNQSVRSHTRKSSKGGLDQSTQPELIPAPLQIRKTGDEIPPLPVLLPPFPPTSVKSNADQTPPKTPDHAPPQLPAIPHPSPISPLPRTPTRQGCLRVKAKTVAEFVELDAASRRRTSSRLSQWLDLEDGEIDQRRLSRYLGTVLDNSFEVPTFEAGPRASVALLRRLSRMGLESLMEDCECPPNTIICQCSSSPEFERFRGWSHHKANTSVSSTACMLGVPRARFQPALYNVTEPTIAELSSPPGLSFDAEDNVSEGGDWGTPMTPLKDDVFGTPFRRSRSYSSKYVIPSPPSTGFSTQSRVQSFSRPFRPDSSYRQMLGDDSAPSTPSRSQSKSTNPKLGFLTSISTMSSFDFDFDLQARRQSLTQHSGDKDFGNHLRTDSNESFASQTSQYEVSTATATVAMSSSSVKPVLINNTAKRGTKQSATTHSQDSTSISASVKTSHSSVTIPDYWRQFDAGVRAHSRSTTMGSNRTDESSAMSAILTLPLLSPKGIRPADKPIAGNAFAQRSNTIAAIPPTIPRRQSSKFIVGLTDTAPDNTLGRSNTTPTLSFFSDQVDNSHVQSHADVNARLRAFFSGNDPRAQTNPPSEANVGLGLSTGQKPRRKKSHRCNDEQVFNRNDSGVFGRVLSPGVDVGGVPGRREFSEPQFYRRADVAEKFGPSGSGSSRGG